MEIRRVPIEQINPAPYNPRKDLRPGDPEYEALKRSIDEFGYVDPCVWNERTGNLVGGHQRFKILVARGDTEVYVSVVDLDDGREKALNVALNNIAGDWDEDKLRELLKDLDAQGFDLTLTGFDQSEIDVFLAGAVDPGQVTEDGFDVEAAAAAIEEPVTKPGDLWILGRHRLLCGDSTKPEDIRRLMDGKLAHMVFTDPPYNVAYVGKTQKAMTIANDSMPGEQFGTFLKAAFTHMLDVLEPGGAFYVCHADIEAINFRRSLIEAGGLIKQTIIWLKNSFVIGRQDYQWQHEPILYGWKPGARHRWFGGRKESTVVDGRVPLAVTTEPEGAAILSVQVGDQQIVLRVPAYEVIHAGGEEVSSVWRFAKPVRNGDHPTMKPVGLPARAIKNSSKPGEVVLDEFLGGGATLIAAEQTDRICVGLELDPRYCDVIVQRWEALTGQKAVRADA